MLQGLAQAGPVEVDRGPLSREVAAEGDPPLLLDLLEAHSAKPSVIDGRVVLEGLEDLSGGSHVGVDGGVC